MKTVYKRHVQIIMLLSAVILILLCGVLVTLKSRDASPAAAEAPYEHSLTRDARPSANPLLEYETNIGGTGDETPLALFSQNGRVYIFGNTSSSDLDFAANQADKTQGFCATLASNGHTEAFTVFPFTIAKVIPTASGFAVAGGRGSAAGLFLLGADLTVTGEATMPTGTPLSAKALFVFDNRYFLLAESVDESTKRTSLLLQTYTSGLALESTKAFSHTYSLAFIDLLPTSAGYLLAAAASFQSRGFLTVARFTLLGEPAYTDFDLGYYYTPYSFVPTADGYAALSSREGKTELLTLTDALKTSGTSLLSELSNEHEKSLFYAGALYAHTGDTLFRLNEAGAATATLAYEVRRIDDFLTDTVASFCVGFDPSGEQLRLGYLGSVSKTETIYAKGGAALLCKSGNRLLVCASASGGADMGRVFGGSDIWLCSISWG